MEHSKIRDKYQSEDVENNWAISYGDMITLLLAFFVLFFNIKTETVNLQLIQKDLDKYFKTAKEGRAPSAVPNSSMKEKSSSISPIYSADVSNALKVKSNIEGQNILVEFPGVAFFPSSSEHLTREGKEALADFAKAIAPHLGAFRLVVRGYTDNRPMKGHKRYKDNLELSAFRSISAIRYLNKKGVDLQVMRIAGYGETDLTTVRAPEDISMLDRKVVIVIEPLDQTERVALNIDKKPETPKKPIEEVSSAQVATASKPNLEPIYRSLVIKGHKAYNILRGRAIKEIDHLDRIISDNKYYKSYLIREIKKDLHRKGHSKAEVNQIIKDIGNREKN